MGENIANQSNYIMKLKIYFVCTLLLLVVLSCEDNAVEKEIPTASENLKIDFDPEEAKSFVYPEIVLSSSNKKAINTPEEIYKLCLSKAEISEFRWANAEDYLLNSAIKAGGGMVELGFSDGEKSNVLYKDENYMKFNRARNYVLEFILREMRKNTPEKNITINDLEVDVPEFLPIIWVKVQDQSIVSKLRQLDVIRYVEPKNFSLDALDPSKEETKIEPYSVGGGCSNIAPSFYQTPFLGQGYNSKVSWHLYNHKVPQAWSISTGKGVAIGIVDTGINSKQALLKYPKFNAGLSSGRTVVNYNLAGDLIDIGHGSGVAGAAAGPVNNDGAITGVAYQSSLVSYRVSSDPWVGTTRSKNNFIEAVEKLARTSSVKVINMSVGRLSYRSSMEDAVNYAYARGKLMICSSGITGKNGGVYPARFHNTIAVTAVPFNQSDPLGINLTNLSPNPYGSYVHFSGYMKRTSDGACALSMNKKDAVVGSDIGSSKAASLVSGIAALVWSANPYLTRDEVVSVMRNAASYDRYRNTKHPNFGYGIIDAERAVLDAVAIGSQCRDLSVSMTGPSTITERGSGTWSVNASGSCAGAVSYKWYNSTRGSGVVSTSSSYTTYFANSDNYMNLQCVVTKSGVSRTVSKSVRCSDCVDVCEPMRIVVSEINENRIEVKLKPAPCPLLVDGSNVLGNHFIIKDSDGKIVLNKPIYNSTQIAENVSLQPGQYSFIVWRNGAKSEQEFSVYNNLK